MPSVPQLSVRTQGLALFVGTLLVFALYDAFAKVMVAIHSPVVVNLSRYLLMGALAGCWLVQLRRTTPDLGSQLRMAIRLPQLWLRSASIATVGTCFMGALVTMPLAEATAIYFTAPLLMVALSSRWLGEVVRPAQWVAVWLGFAGMLLIVRPGSQLPLFGSVLMAVSALCYAVFQLLTRQLAGKIAAPVQYAHMACVCLAVTAVATVVVWPHRWPSAGEWGILLLGAVASCGGQLMMLAAYKRVAASTLGPLNYLQLLLVVAISASWFGLVPDALTLAGTALVAAAGLYLVWPRR